MITISTKRLIGLSNLVFINHCLEVSPNSAKLDLLNLKPGTGREDGFCFYDKHNQDVLICHIDITHKRGRFEVSYGTESPFRGDGYMKEALEYLCNWIFINTDIEVIWALPNGPYKEESIAVLKKCGFEKSDEEFGVYWYALKNDQ